MNARQRSDYWVKVERLRRQLDIKYSSLFKEAISKDLQKVASDLKKYGASGVQSMMGAYAWNDQIMKIMMQLYRETAILFGNASFRAVRYTAQKAADPFGINDEFIKTMMNFLATYGFMLASDITQTTKKQILKIISDGIANNLSIDEISRNITNSDDFGYAMMRARRIARTEVMRSSNYAQMEGAKLHNFVVDKVWIAARDSRTRRIPKDYYDHYHMDGITVPLDQPFTSTGKRGDTVVAMQPGDPNVNKNQLGFIINCRCTVGFVPKRDENGRLIMKR